MSSRTKKLHHSDPNNGKSSFSAPKCRWGGGLFLFLEQKSASKALKMCYLAYFSSPPPPPPLATPLITSSCGYDQLKKQNPYWVCHQKQMKFDMSDQPIRNSPPSFKHGGCLSSSSIPLVLIEIQLPRLKITLKHHSLSCFERALHLLPELFNLNALGPKSFIYRRKPSILAGTILDSDQVYSIIFHT